MKKLLLLIASALGIFSFVMMFMGNLETHALSDVEIIPWDQVFFGHSEQILGSTHQVYNAAPLPFVGFLLTIVAAVVILVVLVLMNKKSKIQNLVFAVCGLVLILGGVFILLTKTTFVDANEDFVKVIELADGSIKMSAPLIIGGIASISAGVTSIVSLFFKK